ncbi:MAG TPA: iron-siderophore ABC transporter substrate-binding protein [Crinalium sp.]|jgi:iron complex transport system substrate-binding protein
MTKFYTIPTLLLAIATAVAVTSCGIPRDTTSTADSAAAPKATPSASCRTVTHKKGITKVCGQPSRIVVLGPNLLELMLALGVQPTGFADYMAFHRGDYTNPREQIPYIGDRVTTQPINVGTDSAPSLESIASIKPDLILATQMNEAQYEQLSGIAPTVILNWFEAEKNLRAIAQAVDRSDQAERLLTESKQRIEKARTTFAPIVAKHPKVLMLSSGNAQELYLVTHKNSFCGSLIQQLGFQLVYPSNISENILDTVSAVSWETLPQLNKADSIILLGYNWDTHSLSESSSFDASQLSTLMQGWQKNAIAQSLNATQSKRVYFMPAYLCLSLPGPIGTELYLDELEKQLLSSQ